MCSFLTSFYLRQHKTSFKQIKIVLGYLELSLAISTYLLLYSVICGYFWLYLVIFCCLRQSPAISVFHSLSPPWINLGLFLDFPWIMPRLLLDYPWIISGLSLDYSWIIPVLSLKYPWIFPGIPLDYPYTISDYH